MSRRFCADGLYVGCNVPIPERDPAHAGRRERRDPRTVPARAPRAGVSDGCGAIPKPDFDRTFDVAWRGNHARTPDSGSGAGLGLAIVKGIVEAHDGTVTVQDELHGCRFSSSFRPSPSHR